MASGSDNHAFLGDENYGKPGGGLLQVPPRKKVLLLTHIQFRIKFTHICLRCQQKPAGNDGKT